MILHESAGDRIRAFQQVVLSWETIVDGDETGSSAYYGWVITLTDEGSHVLIEETHQGPFFLEAPGRKRLGALYRYHQDWVERLARAAEAAAVKATGSTPGATAR